MNWRNTTERYGSLSIGLHWLMLVLIVAVYTCMELHEFFPKGSATRAALKTWHYMLGLSVFALVLVRLAARTAGAVPRIQPELQKWQAWSAKLIHVALYAFMICMPLAGWMLLSAEGDAIPFWGLHLPALIGENKQLAESIQDLHAAGATIGYFLIGAHAAVALFHHYYLRDNTLLRMMPKRD